MHDGKSIERDGHITWLKWHRAHRMAGDISFTADRIVEGMRIGASVEIDLLRFAGDGFVVLHDETLDEATTGTGPVAMATAQTLQTLNLRDHAGKATTHPVMLLDDLARLLGEMPRAPGALLQLDLKEGSAAIRDADIAAFAALVAPVSTSVILSGGDALAVDRLSAAVPGMAIGYDPCHDGAIERLKLTHDFGTFVEDTLATAPKAGMIYLDHSLVLFADDAGHDLIAAFHAAGKRIDAYTIRAATPDARATVERLLALKADQITTDDPVGLEALMNAG